MDLEFHEQLPWLFPHTDARSWFTGSEDLRRANAFRNSSLQGAYLMLAARALGLDCGPMSGFDNAAVDAEFFTGRSAYLCDPEGNYFEIAWADMPNNPVVMATRRAAGA